MPPDQDPAYTLPADAYYHLVRFLRLTLPPPPSNEPDAQNRRDRAAIAQIAGLNPVNCAEAELAGQFVAASEQWKDCLRLAQKPDTPPEIAMKCRAQAATMMRQANSAMRVLLKLQSARQKTESDPEACARADRAGSFVAAMLAAALDPAGTPPQPEQSQESEIETPMRRLIQLPAALLTTTVLSARSPEELHRTPGLFPPPKRPPLPERLPT